MRTILDSWVVIRYLHGEPPAAGILRQLLDAERPAMSWINLGEVFYIMRRGYGEATANSTIRDLRQRIDAELPDVARVVQAARIKSEFRMSYADAFAAATAQAHGAELWTGDPELLVDGAPWAWRDLRSG